MNYLNSYLRSKLDLSNIGFMRGEKESGYFCTPVLSKVIGWAGVDGIHFCKVWVIIMYIETPRMIIRDFTRSDAADLHEIFGDDETMENGEPAYDFEKTKAFLTSFCIGRKAAVAGVLKESGKMMGYILFNAFEAGVTLDSK